MLNYVKIAIYGALVSGLVFGCVSIAFAGTYAEALTQCGQKWRTSDERKAVTKGNGSQAWNAYRAKCVAEIGYERKRGGNVVGTNAPKGE